MIIMNKWKSFGRKVIKKPKYLYKIKLPAYPDMYFTSKKEAKIWLDEFFGKRHGSVAKLMRKGLLTKEKDGMTMALTPAIKYKTRPLFRITIPKEEKKRTFEI
jgi:hypothetical protein